MTPQARVTDFFKAGGTMHLGSPSYVRRAADDELLHQVLAGQYCYVLTARQRGKSSLMIHAAERLRECGVRVAIVDLSGLGTRVTREQWYRGIVECLANDLGLSVDPEQWWRDHRALGPVQCFTDFIHDVALTEIDGPIAIFVDEIDSTLQLDFTDDFFAAIRHMYNLRASSPAYERLTFVLLGVATPADLIKDRSRTPFNIGQPIDLKEFSRADAQPLEAGLEQATPGRGRALLDRVFFWTSGHPYLTQKLCRELAAEPGDGPPDRQVDALVARLFLAEDTRDEDNLRFVQSNVEASPDRRRLLQLYQRVYAGAKVAEDKRSALQNRLRLIGLVRAEGGVLRVRNEIYRRVFDLAWIRENTPVNWAQRVTVGALAISVLLVAAIYLYTLWQRSVTITTLQDDFQKSTNADVRVSYLADLCKLDQATAQEIFFNLNPDQQLAMFRDVNAGAAGPDLTEVVQCLHPSTAEQGVWATQHGQALANAMCCALGRASRDEEERFSRQIGQACVCQASP